MTRPEGYPPTDKCRSCNGCCCKVAPGNLWPCDLSALSAQAVAAHLAGPYSLDWWEGDPREGCEELSRALFLRPAVRGHERAVAHAGFGGTCALLSRAGCDLSFDDRPTGCRIVNPETCMDRTGPNGNQLAALEWLPYQDLLYRALRLAGGSRDDLCYTAQDKLQASAWDALWPQETVVMGDCNCVYEEPGLVSYECDACREKREVEKRRLREQDVADSAA